MRLDPPHEPMPLTVRLDANIGYGCNNDCLFCYFRDRKSGSGHLPTGDAKRLLERIRAAGMEDVELTGGEATLHPEIADIVEYAKKRLMFRSVSVITNGCRMCERGFTEELAGAGLDDALISIHGADAHAHDALTRRQGSFDEAVAAARNARACGLTCRTNTVVNGRNYESVAEIARLVSSLGVEHANFIHFSPLDDAELADDAMMPRYSETSGFLKPMLDAYGGRIRELSVKVIPFCFMEGYEGHVVDLYQNCYDPYEWDYYTRVGIRRGRHVAFAAAALGMSAYLGAGRAVRLGFQRSLREGIMRVEAMRHCAKAKACGECRYDWICPGVWKAYARRYGLGELRPVVGERVCRSDYYLGPRRMNVGDD